MGEEKLAIARMRFLGHLVKMFLVIESNTSHSGRVVRDWTLPKAKDQLPWG